MFWSAGVAMFCGSLAVGQHGSQIGDPADVFGPVRAAPALDPLQLEVKLDDRLAGAIDAGRLVSRCDADLGDLPVLFAEAVDLRPTILLPRAVLDDLYARALASLSEGDPWRPGHPASWFRLTCADVAAARSLRDRLRATDGVEECDFVYLPFVQSVPVAAHDPDDLPPPTADFDPMQRCRLPAPVGLGFDAVRGLVGGQGEGMRVFQSEVDWVIDHEDLGAITTASFVGAPSDGQNPASDHGTGVLGILAAGDNGFGVTGLVHRAELRISSWNSHGSVAGSILACAGEAESGDVLLLISAFDLAMTKPRDFVPAEYFRINFDAVRIATSLGITVVEAATNGDNDLDDPRFGGLFDRSVRDSGAILVGASDGELPVRADFSNYGSRCDISAWGDQLIALGFGTLFYPGNDRLQAYTERFAGTSAASSVIAAVVTIMQGVSRRQNGRTLSPAELRTMLHTGATQTAGAIGLRPDLVPILERELGLPDGLEIDSWQAAPGESIGLDLTGAPGSAAGLVLSNALVSIDLGLNRDLHVDPGFLIHLDTLGLVDGTARYTSTLPNDPSISGATVFLQAVLLGAGQAARLTNSVSLHVR